MSAAESRQMDVSHAGVGSVEWDERLRRLCLQGPFSWWELGNEPWFLAGILLPTWGLSSLEFNPSEKLHLSPNPPFLVWCTPPAPGHTA